MPITNVFKTGGGDSDFTFPAETILLSGEDLRLKGFWRMDQPFTSDRDQFPKLWEYYGDGFSYIFTIDALLSSSSDKHYYILLE